MQNSCLKTSAWWSRSSHFVENGYLSLRFPNMVKMNIHEHWKRVTRFNPLWLSGSIHFSSITVFHDISKQIQQRARIGKIITPEMSRLRYHDGWRPRKRRLKSEFAFFQSLSWLFQHAYFVKCNRTPLELNSYQTYPSSERERKFFHYCLFTSIKKREIRHFHGVVV